MGRRAGKRNTGIKGGGRHSSGYHGGAPRQSRGGKQKTLAKAAELARRVVVASGDDWLTPECLAYLRSLPFLDGSTFSRPILDKSHVKFFKLLKTARFIKSCGKIDGVIRYQLTERGRSHAKEEHDAGREKTQ